LTIRIPEKNKKPGVCYAVTNDGIELPVIDITHPAFPSELTGTELAAVMESSVRGVEAAKKMPPETVRAIAEKSILVRGTVEAAGTYMSGMITYLHRLGPDNLGDGYASAIDRQAAGGLMAWSFRYRLRDVARTVAEAAGCGLSASARSPLHLVDIAGGPSAATLNALILLRKEHPDWLENRKIRIHVLDIDTEGPAYGARALAALMEAGAPLAGLAASFEHVCYDWEDPSVLRRLLDGFETGCVAAAVSEGGLFDYAADEQIVANLETLWSGTPRDFTVVAAVAQDEQSLPAHLAPMVRVQGRPAVRFLGLAALRGLAERAGWAVARVLDSPLHHVAVLEKA
jgi:hypothetical protein